MEVDPVSIASINLTEREKNKIKTAIVNWGTFMYLGENYEDLRSAHYIFVKGTTSNTLDTNSHNNNNNNSNSDTNTDTDIDRDKQIKLLFATLICQHKQFVNFDFFVQSAEKRKFISLDPFLLQSPVDMTAINKMRQDNNLPLKSYKVFLHSSVSEDLSQSQPDTNSDKKAVLEQLVTLLGASVSHHVRLSDLCIVNRVSSQQSFPPHVRPVSQLFLLDCLLHLKLPDFESVKYKPKDNKSRRHRNRI